MTPTRWRLVHDHSSHEYAIRLDREAEWDTWLEIDEENERAWEVPEFAMALDGRFTFCDPRCEE